MRSRVLVCAAALLALGACSKKPETPGGGPTAAAPEAAKTAMPSTPPDRKAGLWEQTMTSDRVNQVTQICLDDTMSKKLSAWGQQMGQSTCTKNSVKPRLGGGWEFETSCDMATAGHLESHGVATGDFGSHYVVDIESTTTGSMMQQANGTHKMKLEATWKGPCPADMRAGDMTMPGGMKINMLDAMEGKGPGMSGKMTAADRAEMQADARKMMEAMKKQQAGN